MKRILFLCLGNSCRSQMAEGFARAYGADVLDVQSAGLSPAAGIAADTIRSMAEKNIKMDGHFPKSLLDFHAPDFDLIINMSGYPLLDPGVPVREWTVRDPIGESMEVYAKVRDRIENLVMQLILEFRREAKPRPDTSQGPR